MPDLHPLSTCETFSTTNDHILENGRRGQSVVTVSWGSKGPIRLEDIEGGGYWLHGRIVRGQLEELVDVGTFVLFAPGDAAQDLEKSGHQRDNVDTAPATFARVSAMLRVLAVLNVNNRGKLWWTSQSLLGPFAAR